MPRFTAEDFENYGGSSELTPYFSLKNDGDIARVRIMYNDADDVEGFAVHEIEIDGRRKYINCPRKYNDPVSKCPFCENGYSIKSKVFVPLYNLGLDNKNPLNEVQIWERGGKTFFQRLLSICSRYKNTVSHIFEIERHGKAGDKQTRYEFYEVDKDDTKLEDLPEFGDVLGKFVLNKSYEDMQYFIEHGEFPYNKTSTSRNADDEEYPVRRRSRVDESENHQYSRRTPARRTPINNDDFTDDDVPF